MLGLSDLDGIGEKVGQLVQRAPKCASVCVYDGHRFAQQSLRGYGGNEAAEALAHASAAGVSQAIRRLEFIGA